MYNIFHYFHFLYILHFRTPVFLLFVCKYLALFLFHFFRNCLYADFFVQELELENNVERSKRRSYFLSRFFGRKCEFISQPHSINKCLGYQELPIPVPWVILPLTSGREERFSVKSKKFGRIWLAVEKRFDFLCFHRMFLWESSLRKKWQLKLSSTIIN